MNKTAKTIKRTKFIGLEGLNFAVRPIHTSLISLLVIRSISKDLWGQFVYFLLAIEIITMFLNWGQRAYLMREFSLQPQRISSLLSTTLMARIPLLIVAALVLFVWPNFRVYFWSLFLWLTFKWLANLFESLIKYNRHYWHSILAEMLAMVAAVGYLLIQYPSVKISEVIFAFMLSSIVRLLVLSPLLSTIRLLKVNWNRLKSNLKSTFPLFAISFTALLQMKGDLYTATFFLEDIKLAEYQVMISFLVLGQTISWIILGPFQKNLYRWKQSNIGELKKKYRLLGMLISFVFSILLFLGLDLFYKIHLDYWYIILFYVYVFLLYIYLIESQLLLKHRLENRLLKFNVLAIMASVILSIVLIPFLGMLGALISGIISKSLMAVLVVKDAKKIIIET